MPSTEKMPRRPLNERIRDCEERSARALIQANQLNERGERERAEVYYERSTQWLMKANDLRECGHIRNG